ncbi:MAG: hypothetical protein GX875_01720, partial [Propionibacterium sp.]|nr:hypothetical protein [Propionibacterium sp.]
MTPIMVHLTMIGVGHDVPLAAVDLLACVVAAKQEPPVKPLPKVVANTTDPDSRVMPTRRGYAQGYNAQVAVTSDHIGGGPPPTTCAVHLDRAARADVPTKRCGSVEFTEGYGDG